MTLCFTDLFDQIKFLGAGEFGQVVLVNIKPKFTELFGNTPNSIAVKLTKLKGLSEKHRIRIKNEVEVLQTLGSHPGIVEYYGSCELVKNDKRYLAIFMEYLEGNTMEKYIRKAAKKEKYISDEQLKDIMKQLLSSLAHIHERGAIHRDIKAENIIVTNNSTFKIVDFGLSCINKISSSDVWHAISGIGTPTHLSPEIWRICRKLEPSRDISSNDDIEMLKKCDIWSLGITFYHLIFKDIPFEDSMSDDDMIDLIISPEPLEIPQSNFTSLLQGMLEKDWRNRSPIDQYLLTSHKSGNDVRKNKLI